VNLSTPFLSKNFGGTASAGSESGRGQAVSGKRFFTTAGSESGRGQTVSDKRFFTKPSSRHHVWALRYTYPLHLLLSELLNALSKVKNLWRNRLRRERMRSEDKRSPTNVFSQPQEAKVNEDKRSPTNVFSPIISWKNRETRHFIQYRVNHKTIIHVKLK